MQGTVTESESAGGSRFVLAPAPAASASGPVVLDADQRRVVDHPGSAVVLGGPGSGKTTTLVEWVSARVAAGGPTAGLDRFLVLTHGRAAAQALRARLVSRLGRTQTGASVMTLHGFSHALVRRFGRSEAASEVRLLTAPEQDFRIRELLEGHDASGWPGDLAAAARTRGLAAQMRAALARARQLGMDPADLEQLAEQTGVQTWRAVAGFFEEYLDVVDAEGVLDYAELIHRARLLLLDPGVRAALAADYEGVAVDEFAESDPSQWRLVADLAGLGLSTVVFADPSTQVFGFRGADPRAVTGVGEALDAADGGPVARFALTIDHRHADEVRRAVGRVARRLPSGRQAPDLMPADAVRAGLVRALVFDSAGAEADHIADLLRTARLDDGLEWSQMAVVCRTARGQLPVLARTLTAAGVPVEVAGDDLALSDEPAVRPLLLGLDLAAAIAAETPVEADAMLRFLQSPIAGLDSLGVRRLGRALRQAARGGPDAAVPSAQLVSRLALAATSREPDASTDDGGGGDDTVAGDAIGSVPAAADRAAVERAGRLLARVAGVVASGAVPSVALWELWSGSSWPRRLQDAALGGGDGARRAHRDLDAVVALFDVAARQEQYVGQRGIRWLLAEVSGQSIPADTARESHVRHRGVRLVTAHRTKGLEWPLVIVCGAQEGSWPTLGRRSRLIDPDQLDPAALTESGLLPDPGSVVADERRLFLAAISRARDRLVVTAAAGSDGEVDHPSRFLGELGVPLEFVHGRPRRPTTLAGLSADLRRTAIDPETPPALREAAAERLARLADLRDRSGRRVARGADPATWWGIHDTTRNRRPVVDPDGPVELSGSALEAVLRCPRQWFLARRARADAPSSSAQSLGSLIHALVQHAVDENLTLDTLSQRLDEVWRHVRFDASWLAASERIEADAALTRFAAWQQQYGGRQVLGVEVPFRQEIEVDGQPVVLVGTVDRLEVDTAGRLRIIDFKTGRSVPTAAAAASSDQMGLYQLAATAGAFDAVGPSRAVAGADLVYLRRNDGPTPFPKILSQPSLNDSPHPGGGAPEGEDGERPHRPTWVHDRVAEAVGIIREERFNAVRNGGCQFCAFRIGCPSQGAELLR
ncbi:MAG TPA: ATP-dependent DNA helicase [Propionibacteriaceae bacterium]|nr:ATP-dependent DNA helicase [Propionibacteriaceae bacterium]